MHFVTMSRASSADVTKCKLAVTTLVTTLVFERGQQKVVSAFGKRYLRGICNTYALVNLRRICNRELAVTTLVTTLVFERGRQKVVSAFGKETICGEYAIDMH